jgi:hypothetical protein
MVVSLLALFIALGGTTYAATGRPFILGRSNSASTPSKLSSAANPTLALTNTGGKPAATFSTKAGVAPFRVNRSTKVANLNADLLDGLDSAALQARVTGVCAEGEAVQGVDAAGAVQCAPFVMNRTTFPAQNGGLYLSESLQTDKMIHTGSESGTSQVPGIGGAIYDGLVVRRIIDTSQTGAAGRVIARTDTLTLERDGTLGGWRITRTGATGGLEDHKTIVCQGVDTSGVTVNFVNTALPMGTTAVYTNAQAITFAHCAFGNPFLSGHVTEVTLLRAGADAFWVGNVISTFNQ